MWSVGYITFVSSVSRTYNQFQFLVMILEVQILSILFAEAVTRSKSANFTPELREYVEDAGVATQKAFSNLRRIIHMETGEGPAAAPMATADEVFGDKDKDKALAPEVVIMQPIFRFFQLLCENHNLELQVNGSFTGGFGLLAVEFNWKLKM